MKKIRARRKVLYEELGKFLLDLAKLVFGGVILTGIVKYDTVHAVLLYGTSALAVGICMVMGLYLISISKTDKKK
jgi:hypothetical protein